MSVESTALSRSKLEQKDRGELAAIVEAMGGKATSRSKKADLVDLVLQLAGAGNGSENDNQAAEKSAPKQRAPKKAVASEPHPAPLAETDDEPPAEWQLAAAAAPTEAP